MCRENMKDYEVNYKEEDEGKIKIERRGRKKVQIMLREEKHEGEKFTKEAKT